MSAFRFVLVAKTLVGLGLASAGCTIGAGSTYVGQWAPRSEVDHRVCVENAKRVCARSVEVSVDRPARAFEGVMIIFPAAGAAHVTEANRGSSIAARMDTGLEYVRGDGRWAYGFRASFMLEGGAKGSAIMTPLTALGYVSVAERLALHAGVGYSPYTKLHYGDDPRTNATVVRGLIGTDVLLMRRGEVHFSSKTELDTSIQLEPYGGYRSTGLTTSVAIHF